MGRLFGTDGIRGVANSTLSTALAMKVGAAAAYALSSKAQNPTVLVAVDTRKSGEMLCSALVSGILSVGGNVKQLGVIPTPALPYLTRLYGADAAVMVSASHNSMEFNGIKWFDRYGFKLSDEMEDRIEALIDDYDNLPFPQGEYVGSMIEVKRAREDYMSFLMGCCERKLDGIKIALDCANGASSAIAPELFTRLGAEVIVTANEPDGCNINRNCGSTHINNLSEFVIENRADVGFAFDGDADRVLAVDERGNLVNGDKIMGICAKSLNREGKLKNSTLVATIMSNIGLTLSMKEEGIETIATKVGDRNVLECMRRDGHTFGGEQSGHIIFYEKNTSGDGMLTAIMLMNIITRSSKSISALADEILVFPQKLVNIKMKNEAIGAALDDAKIWEYVGKIHAELNGNGRVVLRSSGTEPLIRIMIEGSDENDIHDKVLSIANMIAEKYGGDILKMS